MAKVTGIGGIFFKARSDKAALAKWYADHLGISVQAWGGAALKWSDDHAEDRGSTAWVVAGKGDGWFPFNVMINYRVDDLAGLLAQLKTSGIEPVSGPEHHENGAFAWLLDPEGNKVELWEPKIWDAKNKK